MATLHEIRALIGHAITAITAHLSQFFPHKKCKIMYQVDAMNEAWQKCENLGRSSSQSDIHISLKSQLAE